MFLPNVLIQTVQIFYAHLENGRLNGDVYIRNRGVDTLKGLLQVNGNLKLYDTAISEISDLIEITGDLVISHHVFRSPLESLGSLVKVGGDVHLRYSEVTDLGNLKYVGGNLNLRDTDVQSIGSVFYIGGNLFLPKSCEGKIDLEGVEVKGKVRYWNNNNSADNSKLHSITQTDDSIEVPNWTSANLYSLSNIKSATTKQKNFYSLFKRSIEEGRYIDLKGNTNYLFSLYHELIADHNLNGDTKRLKKLFSHLSFNYPEIESYTDSAISNIDHNLFVNSSSDKELWDYYYKKGSTHLLNVLDFEYKLDKQLVDGKIIIRWGQNNMTSFGQENGEKIEPFVEICLRKFETKSGLRFLDNFFSFTTDSVKNKNGLLSIDPRDLMRLSDGKYNQDYYKDFYRLESDYWYSKKIDDNYVKDGWFGRWTLTYVVSNAISNQCGSLCREAEDLFREAEGLPKIGEGWISETTLYYLIKENLVNHEVIHHGSEKWLGRQHLDIYIPELKIAVEYQGRQHSEPVEFFGGQEAFEKNLERDARKKRLCDENGVNLLYVYPETDRDDFIQNLLKLAH